jgi:hypothetical protein
MHAEIWNIGNRYRTSLSFTAIYADGDNRPRVLIHLHSIIRWPVTHGKGPENNIWSIMTEQLATKI